MLDNMPESEMDTKHKVRIMIAAYTPVDLYRKFEERYHLDIIEGYTLTESPSALFNRPGDVKIGSIGKPMSGVDAKIVDDEDNELPAGEIGEIVLKGPAVMKEYFKNPEATSETLKGGWLHTGDLGKKDDEGYFHFSGRKKDIIRRGGENIGAQEVEGVLNAHPKIAESAVIPVPDRVRNEEIKAFIILKPGQELKPEEIVDHCSERLAEFKVPRYIEFVDSFPKTAKMTIKKHELRNMKQDHATGCFLTDIKASCSMVLLHISEFVLFYGHFGCFWKGIDELDVTGHLELGGASTAMVHDLLPLEPYPHGSLK